MNIITQLLINYTMFAAVLQASQIASSHHRKFVTCFKHISQTPSSYECREPIAFNVPLSDCIALYEGEGYSTQRYENGQEWFDVAVVHQKVTCKKFSRKLCSSACEKANKSCDHSQFNTCRCPKCESAKNNQKVCGTDYRLYESECEMKRESCRKSKIIDVLAYDKCPNDCSAMGCSGGCLTDQNHIAHCITSCAAFCHMRAARRAPFHQDAPDRPICSSRQRTFDNYYALCLHSCSSDAETIVAHGGECLAERGAAACAVASCGVGHTCLLDDKNRAVCYRCSHLSYCKAKDILQQEVCDEEGNRYDSYCQMKERMCNEKRFRVFSKCPGVKENQIMILRKLYQLLSSIIT